MGTASELERDPSCGTPTPAPVLLAARGELTPEILEVCADLTPGGMVVPGTQSRAPCLCRGKRVKEMQLREGPPPTSPTRCSGCRGEEAQAPGHPPLPTLDLSLEWLRGLTQAGTGVTRDFS